MPLKECITNDIKAALLGGDRFVVDTLRGLKAAILNEEVALGKREEGLDDTSIEAVIAREAKKRAESKALYEQNGRQELADNEQRELEVLQQYLPKQLTEEEIQKEIDLVINELGISGMQAMGQVIGAVKGKCGTAADGAVVARLVKATLQ